MQGFDYEMAKADWGSPESVDVLTLIAIGKRGQREICQITFKKRSYQTSENH